MVAAVEAVYNSAPDTRNGAALVVSIKSPTITTVAAHIVAPQSELSSMLKDGNGVVVTAEAEKEKEDLKPDASSLSPIFPPPSSTLDLARDMLLPYSQDIAREDNFAVPDFLLDDMEDEDAERQKDVSSGSPCEFNNFLTSFHRQQQQQQKQQVVLTPSTSGGDGTTKATTVTTTTTAWKQNASTLPPYFDTTDMNASSAWGGYSSSSSSASSLLPTPLSASTAECNNSALTPPMFSAANNGRTHRYCPLHSSAAAIASQHPHCMHHPQTPGCHCYLYGFYGSSPGPYYPHCLHDPYSGGVSDSCMPFGLGENGVAGTTTTPSISADNKGINGTNVPPPPNGTFHVAPSSSVNESTIDGKCGAKRPSTLNARDKDKVVTKNHPKRQKRKRAVKSVSETTKATSTTIQSLTLSPSSGPAVTAPSTSSSSSPHGGQGPPVTTIRGQGIPGQHKSHRTKTSYDPKTSYQLNVLFFETFGIGRKPTKPERHKLQKKTGITSRRLTYWLSNHKRRFTAELQAYARLFGEGLIHDYDSFIDYCKLNTVPELTHRVEEDQNEQQQQQSETSSSSDDQTTRQQRSTSTYEEDGNADGSGNDEDVGTSGSDSDADMGW